MAPPAGRGARGGQGRVRRGDRRVRAAVRLPRAPTRRPASGPRSTSSSGRSRERYEDLGELGAALNATPLAGWLETPYSYLATTKASQYTSARKPRAQDHAAAPALPRRLPVREGAALVLAARRRSASARWTSTCASAHEFPGDPQPHDVLVRDRRPGVHDRLRVRRARRLHAPDAARCASPRRRATPSATRRSSSASTCRSARRSTASTASARASQQPVLSRACAGRATCARRRRRRSRRRRSATSASRPDGCRTSHQPRSMTQQRRPPRRRRALRASARVSISRRPKSRQKKYATTAIAMKNAMLSEQPDRRRARPRGSARRSTSAITREDRQLRSERVDVPHAVIQARTPSAAATSVATANQSSRARGSLGA